MDNTIITSSDCERPFWKVFHNKYLFKKIFHFIETTEWIQYDNTDGYHVGNRKKFKEITSLSWIIKHGQHELLKWKLEHNETIEIDLYSLKQLFFLQKEDNSNTSFLKYCSDKGFYRDGDELSFKNGQSSVSTKNQLNSKMLSLILKHKSNQLLQQFDLFAILLSDYHIKDEDEDDESEDYGEDDDEESEENEKEDEDEESDESNDESDDEDEEDKKELTNIKYKPNLELLNVFINEPFSLLITNNMVKKALENHPYNDKLIEFILDNSKSNDKTKNKRFKQLDGSQLSTSSKKEDKDDEPISMSFETKQFLKIKSISVQNRLLDLNYVKLDNGYNKINISSDNNNRIKELYNQYIKISRATFNNLRKRKGKEFRIDAERICKVYLKKYDQVINSSGLCLNNNFIVKYGLERYHSNSINYLMTLSESEFGQLKYYKSNSTSKYIKLPITNEFIKCFTNDKIYSSFSCLSIDKYICNYIYSIYGTDEYHLAIDSISNDNFKNINFTKSMWLSFVNLQSPISELFILRDKERVDWMVENYEIVKARDHDSSLDFTFLSSEILEYAKLKFQSSPKLENYFSQHNKHNNRKYISTLFSISLNNCDIKSLEYLNENFKDVKIQSFEDCSRFLGPIIGESDQDKLIYKQIREMKRYTQSFINFNNQTTSKLIELLDYLNSNNFRKLFANPSLFQSFIKAIDYIGIGNGNGGSVDLSKLKIDFTVFEDISMWMFVGAFNTIKSVGSIQLFLNNFNPFSTKKLLDILESYWYKLGNSGNNSIYYTYPGEPSHFSELSTNCLFYDIKTNENDVTTSHYCESGECSDVLLQVIELILCKFVENYKRSTLESPGIVPLIINKFQSLINFLLKKLIKSKGITIEKVKTVVTNIKTTWNSTKHSFNFQHSIYHSFFYLGIRSMKLIKFIFELPANYYHMINIEDDGQFVNQESFINIYSVNEEEKQLKPGDIFQYLDPNIFTFDFIFESSFNTILSTLINHLLYSPFMDIGDIKHKPDEILDSVGEMYYSSLDSTLCYLLDIREFDLFSKTLDTIQSQLDDATIKIGIFPESVTPTSKRLFLYSNELQSKAIQVLNVDLFHKFCFFNSKTSIGGEWKTKKGSKLALKECSGELYFKFKHILKNIN